MNWDQIEGFDGWATTLEQLIIALSNAFANKDQTGKNVALQNLRNFIKYSPNDIASPLDDIALRTVMGAIAKDWGEGVEELAARSAELAKLTKQIQTITQENIATAENIQMKQIRAVIDESTNILKSYSDLKTQIQTHNNPDSDTLVAKVNTAIKAIQNLRDSVERI